ncbi:MAG: septum formation initiator family protein [Chloroflexi bacterium]|nr:septum formation initiator family protein [Chloroflexota bacterium]
MTDQAKQPQAADQRHPTNETVSVQKRPSQLSGIQVMFAAILSIGLILAINFSSRIAASQPLQEAHNLLQAEIERLEAEQAELTQQRDYVRGDAYVERWARDEGKLVREGEVLVVPVPGGGLDAPTPAPEVRVRDAQTAPPEPEPWMVWWALFFDVAPPDLE